MFKKPIFVLGILCSLHESGTAQVVQEGRQRNSNYFYVSPIDLVLNTFELGYERRLANENTIIFLGGVKLSKKSDYFDRLGGLGEFQYRVNLHYDKAAANTLNRNFSTFAYFAPYVTYRYEQLTEQNVGSTPTPVQQITIVNSGFAGVGFGFRLTANESRFCMNLFAGGGLKYSDNNGSKKYDDFIQVGYTGIAPKISFQMGIAF